MMACHVLMAQMMIVIASTYCENLLALVLSRYVNPPTNSDVMEPISQRYLSVIWIHSYSCPGNLLYCSKTLMLSCTEVIS